MITTKAGTSIKVGATGEVFVSKNKRNFYRIGTVTTDRRFAGDDGKMFGPDVLRAIADLIDGRTE